MPQMNPIMWLLLFFIFSFIFIMFNILNYFNFFYNMKTLFLNSNFHFKCNNLLNWKW